MKLFKNEYEGQTKAFKSGKPMDRFNPSLQDKEDGDEPTDISGINLSNLKIAIGKLYLSGLTFTKE